MVISPRDLYTDTFYNILEDGTIICCQYSSQDEYPIESGIVRMSYPNSGFIIKPLKDNKNKCSIEFYIEADTKITNVPLYAIQVALKQGAYGFVKLSKVMPEFKKKYAKDIKTPLIE